MQARQTLTIIGLSFFIAMGILILIAGATMREWRDLDKRLGWVSHTQKVIDTLDRLESGLRDAGAAGRDYLSTPDSRALVRFEHGLQLYRTQMDALTLQTRNNAAQQAEIELTRAKIENKIVIWRSLLSARAGFALDGASLVEAMKTMTIGDLLSHIMTMRKIESGLLSLRIEQSSQAIRTGRQFVICGFILCWILLLGSFAYVILQIRRRLAAERSLLAINNSLEERIHLRTQDLARSNRSLKEEVLANQAAREEIRALNTGLEQRVQERTSQLESANKELESFSYSVSHDLRTPLRAIVGFSRMLRDRMGPRLEDEDKRLLGVIVDNATRMSGLIDDLLNFSRLGRTQLSRNEINTAQLVEDVLQEMRSNPELSAQAGRADIVLTSLPNCFGDRNLLGQVWRNLLGNALKFSGEVDAPRICIEGTEAEAGSHYRVSDNGVGFDMRYYDKLFGVFQRLHTMEEFPGTGVGLAIVQRIVSRHGGRVWAEAVLGQGAIFHFTVPRADAR